MAQTFFEREWPINIVDSVFITGDQRSEEKLVIKDAPNVTGTVLNQDGEQYL